MPIESRDEAPSEPGPPRDRAWPNSPRRLTTPEPAGPMLDSPMPYVLGVLALISTVGLFSSVGNHFGRFGFFLLLSFATAMLTCGWLSARTMTNRGRSARLGWALGLTLGIPELLICAFLPLGRTTDQEEPAAHPPD